MRKKMILVAAFLTAATMLTGLMGGFFGGDAPTGLPSLAVHALESTQPQTVVNDIEYLNNNYDSPKYEMRAAWVATVTNIDMPKGMDEAAFRQWANEVCESLRVRNFNTIIFQVKPVSDALYRSEYAPWSAYITGSAQGTNPGYDPLAIMLDAAHTRGLELHGWINPYRVTMPSGSLATLSPDNFATKYPGVVLKYGQQYYLNPGIPFVQEYLINCVSELVENYDVDGIHIDDYFYPYAIAGEAYPDNYTYETYGKDFASQADWRRDNVNKLVAGINAAIKSKKPHVQFGISPFGVWRNASVDPTGSDTRGGQTTYDSLYADTRQWLKDGTVDYLTPQIYWSRQHKLANFTTLLNWWDTELDTYSMTHPVHLYIGLADYRIGNDSDEAWKSASELLGQISDIRNKPNARGQMHFSYRSVMADTYTYMTQLTQSHYQYKTIAPSTYWNMDTEVFPPTAVTASAGANGVTITIADTTNQSAVNKYAIYRVERGTHLDYDNPANLIGIVYKSSGVIFTDTTAVKGKSYDYGVKALSGTNVESADSVTAAISF